MPKAPSLHVTHLIWLWALGLALPSSMVMGPSCVGRIGTRALPYQVVLRGRVDSLDAMVALTLRPSRELRGQDYCALAPAP